MAKRKTVVPFKGTAEQEKQLKELIASHKDMQGALMPVLQQAQEIYGYLPIEVQTMIAEGLGIPLEEVYGVATFYGQFTLNPKGEYQIAVCLGTACYVRGSGDVLERIEKKLDVERGGITKDGKFSLDATRCLGACGLAPVMTINGEVYGRLVPADVDRILDQYINA
jgi:NADP-reducing hydrogenase subunit HndA